MRRTSAAVVSVVLLAVGYLLGSRTTGDALAGPVAHVQSTAYGIPKTYLTQSAEGTTLTVWTLSEGKVVEARSYSKTFDLSAGVDTPRLEETVFVPGADPRAPSGK
jgi:hypothetical protein